MTIVRFSDRVEGLWEKIAPYLDSKGQLKSDAPLDIREAHREFLELGNKEAGF